MASKNDLKGFTLIELLLAIAIIGMITSVILLAQRDTKVKQRDAKRYTDAKQVQQALALYLAKYQSYPISPGVCLDNSGTDPVNASMRSQGIISNDAKFVDPLYPTDPNKCYWYSGTANNYSFRYTIEKDNSVSKAGTYTIVP